MNYSFGTKLEELAEDSPFPPGKAKIQLMDLDQYKHGAEAYPHRKLLIHDMENLHYSKAEAIGSCIMGTYRMPDKKKLENQGLSFGFYLEKDRLILLEDTGKLKNVLAHLKASHYTETASAAAFFAMLLDYLIRDDVLFLQNYEKKLAAIEEELLVNMPRDFYQTVIRCRKDLLALHTYYEQLVDMGEAMESGGRHVCMEEEASQFSNFSKRADRLHDHVEMLREYVLQIREMYQSQMSLAQNRVMNWLTVVTTIFLPLSLLVGWYGMNFQDMPELHWRYGYVAMVLISIAIIVLEILFFKKRKML